MKRNFLASTALVALIACGDNMTDNTKGAGGSIDSNYSAPAPATDHTTVKPDTPTMDTNSTMGDTTMRKSGEGSAAPGAPAGATGQGAAPSASRAGTTSQGNAPVNDEGNSSGQAGSGASTNSKNSGSSSDENKGSTR
jgi:hypothetical protein